MTLRKPSLRANAVARVISDRDISDDADSLADILADKSYGESVEQGLAKAKAKALSISLPECLVSQLEDAAFANKRSGNGQKTVSGIIKQALEISGYGNSKK